MREVLTNALVLANYFGRFGVMFGQKSGREHHILEFGAIEPTVFHPSDIDGKTFPLVMDVKSLGSDKIYGGNVGRNAINVKVSGEVTQPRDSAGNDTN